MVTAGLLSRARAGDGEAFRELTGPHRCVRLIAGLGGGTVKGYPEGAGSVPAGFLFNGALSTQQTSRTGYAPRPESNRRTTQHQDAWGGGCAGSTPAIADRLIIVPAQIP